MNLLTGFGKKEVLHTDYHYICFHITHHLDIRANYYKNSLKGNLSFN